MTENIWNQIVYDYIVQTIKDDIKISNTGKSLCNLLTNLVKRQHPV